MIFETTITIRPEDEKNEKLIRHLVLKQLGPQFGPQLDLQLARQERFGYQKSSRHERFAQQDKFACQEKKSEPILVQTKKSIDARKGRVKYHLRYKVYVGENPEDDESANFVPKWRNIETDENGNPFHTVVIVGCGPAGLFAALRLLENGIKPIVLERGSRTSKRKVDIANISRTGIVDENSNYCFGEGGAGTFSDGKLYTRSNKRGNISRIMQIFVHFGADPKILTDSHPHIGSDRLPKIVNSMVETIRNFGGEVHFNTRVTDLILSQMQDGKYQVAGVKCVSVSENSVELEILSDATILATGHSATDIYEILSKIENDLCGGICSQDKKLCGEKILEEKTFAVGVRVEHPRKIIDKIQYHSVERLGVLPAAEYRLVTQVEERGVYSFCMCPGGNVVPSQSANGQIVVNGMSSSSRNSPWSNAAIVVEVKPEDCSSYGGSLAFRSWLERTTYEQSESQKAPAQLLTDFLAGRETLQENLPKTSYTPGLVASRLDLWLPDFIARRLKIAFKDFDSKMHGFICSQAVLIASETRTSTPVRILRDKETFENPILHGLYPAGEGSGYAGGITSSAMDGENAAAKISLKIIF